MAKADTQKDAAATSTGAVDEASRTFVGQWHTLISTTNWEKGRIIGEWRAAKETAGEEVNEYSDEAWAALVGEVTSQHVGRLRRVFDRFGEVYSEYDGLYWSHFHAALDWDDAEIWLEGALQKGWSVSQMRRQRGKAHGNTDDDANVTTARLPAETGAEAGTSQLVSVTDPEEEFPETDGPARADAGATSNSDDMPAAGRSTATTKSRPFESLAELPDDLADAFESMKLAILAHKLSEWKDVSCDDVLASLEALKELALAPSG